LPCVSLLPPYAVYPAPIPFPGCPSIFPFTTTWDSGGTAFDNDGNFLSGGTAFPVMFQTDGRVLEMVDPVTGAFIISWPVGNGLVVPGPISGLGYDSTADVIWITDGHFCAGLGLSPSCTIPLPVIVPAFPLPTTPPGTVPATGLDYDPCSGTVWYCDFAGNVVNCTTAGVFLSSFIAMPFLTQGLTGLTVNTATPPVPGFMPNVQVTDGFSFAEFRSNGALAASGPFYRTTNPYPLPVFGFAPVSGLGFTLRPNYYGKGCPASSGLTPSIGWAGGYPYINNAGFQITLTNATPGSFAYLVVNTSMACPPLPLLGCPFAVWVTFPWTLLLPVGAVPASGNLTVAAPMPASPTPCSANVGLPIFCQFITVNLPGPTLAGTTEGLAFTIGDA
ncbi:MAG: hypothetical protein ABIK28_04120, partial [Planctomycetota bacterium]